MKPDKHKQKRTQLYKKKHGIKDDKQENKQKENENQAQGKSHMGKPRAPAQAERGFRQSEDSSSDEENVGPSYRRRCGRNLPSNWERYEELPEDTDSVTTRGADFSTLLQGSSSAVSQFRFVDEIALDEDVNDAAECKSFLVLDPHSLVEALRCIPLHQKLGVEGRLFEKEIITQFLEEAESHKKLYDEQIDSRGHQSLIHVVAMDTPGDAELDLHTVLSNDGQTTDRATKFQTKTMEVNPSELFDNLDDILSGEGPTMVKEIQINTTSNPNRNDCDDNLLSDEDISEPKSVQQEPNDQSEQNETMEINTNIYTGKVTNIEDDLDQLLSLDNLEDINSSKSKSKPKVDDEDLEDWLDSVLDA